MPLGSYVDYECVLGPRCPRPNVDTIHVAIFSAVDTLTVRVNDSGVFPKADVAEGGFGPEHDLAERYLPLELLDDDIAGVRIDPRVTARGLNDGDH